MFLFWHILEKRKYSHGLFTNFIGSSTLHMLKDQNCLASTGAGTQLQYQTFKHKSAAGPHSSMDR